MVKEVKICTIEKIEKMSKLAEGIKSEKVVIHLNKY